MRFNSLELIHGCFFYQLDVLCNDVQQVVCQHRLQDLLWILIGREKLNATLQTVQVAGGGEREEAEYA